MTGTVFLTNQQLLRLMQFFKMMVFFLRPNNLWLLIDTSWKVNSSESEHWTSLQNDYNLAVHWYFTFIWTGRKIKHFLKAKKPKKMFFLSRIGILESCHSFFRWISKINVQQHREYFARYKIHRMIFRLLDSMAHL